MMIRATAISQNTVSSGASSGLGDLKDLWIYAGWMGSMVRWIYVYIKNRAHPQISLIASALLWGVLFAATLGPVIRSFSTIPIDVLGGR